MKKRNLIFTLIISLVFVCCIFAGCTSTPATYEITVKTFGANHGSVEGGNATYTEGEKVTIKAVPASSSSNTNKFFCWLLNNKVVSNKAEYTFEVNKDTAGDYIAIFTSPYLEYFSLTEVNFNSGIDTETNTDTYVTNIKLYFGEIENLTTLAYSTEGDVVDNKLTLNSTDIYKNDSKPYAYNIQKDIYIKIVVKYIQDDVEFVSTTNAKIVGNDNVTITIVELKNENESTADNTVGISLNNGINAENEDLRLNIANTPTLSLKFERLSNFVLEEETDSNEN